jgi:hypothetical protein
MSSERGNSDDEMEPTTFVLKIRVKIHVIKMLVYMWQEYHDNLGTKLLKLKACMDAGRALLFVNKLTIFDTYLLITVFYSMRAICVYK